MCERRDPLNTL